MKKYVMAAAILVGGLVSGALAADPLVDVDWVKSNIDKSEVVFLDVRGKLAGRSKADYLRGHIPGAVWTNYLKDGWRSKDAGGTVGQLSSTAKLEKLIGGLGIGNTSHVVIIPEGGRALDMGTATRVYWTFKVLGHDNVSILNGGMIAYTKAVDANKKPVNPLEKGEVKAEPTTFAASLRQDMIITKADVKAAMESKVTLLDHRPNNQYVGVNRHGKAKRFGTIPGAKNLPENWITVGGGGMFRNAEQLAKLYSAAGSDAKEPQINFCNTGHWASLGWFVSHELMGNKQSRMYDGSMVEWSADKSLPMEQKANVN